MRVIQRSRNFGARVAESPQEATHRYEPVAVTSNRRAPLVLPAALGTGVGDAEDEVDDDGEEEDDGEDGGAEAVVEAGLAPHAYGFRAPVVGEEGVDHGEHGDAGEEEGGDEGGPVAEVQHADGQRPQDHREVQPRQERPLVGEEDLGLDARRQGDPLA